MYYTLGTSVYYSICISIMLIIALHTSLHGPRLYMNFIVCIYMYVYIYSSIYICGMQRKEFVVFLFLQLLLSLFLLILNFHSLFQIRFGNCTRCEKHTKFFYFFYFCNFVFLLLLFEIYFRSCILIFILFLFFYCSFEGQRARAIAAKVFPFAFEIQKEFSTSMVRCSFATERKKFKLAETIL